MRFKNLLIIIILIISINAIAQNNSSINITSRQLSEKVDLNYSHILQDGSVLKARADGKFIVFTKFDSKMNLVFKDKKVEFVYNTEVGKNYFHTIQFLNNNIYVIAKQIDRENKIMHIIAQAINSEDLSIEIKPRVIFSSPWLTGKWNEASTEMNRYFYTNSDNFLLFKHYVKSDVMPKYHIAYTLIDRDLEFYWSNVNKNQYVYRQTYTYYKVSDSGVFALAEVINEYDAEDNFLGRFNDITLFDISGEVIKKIRIPDEEGFALSNLHIEFSDDDMVYIAGIQSAEKWGEYWGKGLVRCNYNLKTNELSDIAFYEIPYNIMTENFSKEEQNIYDKQQSKFTVKSMTYRDFFFSSMLPHKDGHYLTIKQNTMFSKSDIIVISIDKKNNINWIKKVPRTKRKSKTYDYGNGSFEYLKDDTYHILYTDKIDYVLNPQTVKKEVEQKESELLVFSIKENGEKNVSSIIDMENNEGFEFLVKYGFMYKHHEDFIYLFSKNKKNLRMNILDLN